MKIGLDFSSESSARQRIHTKNQALFSSKGISKKLKCRLLQFLLGDLRVKILAKLIFGKVFLQCGLSVFYLAFIYLFVLQTNIPENKEHSPKWYMFPYK